MVESREALMERGKLVRLKETPDLPAPLCPQRLKETPNPGFLMTVKNLKREKRRRRRAATKR